MKLKIYMKSGNVIKLGGIKEYNIENKGNEITGISLLQNNFVFGFIPRARLLVKTIDLNQIEALVRC